MNHIPTAAVDWNEEETQQIWFDAGIEKKIEKAGFKRRHPKAGIEPSPQAGAPSFFDNEAGVN